MEYYLALERIGHTALISLLKRRDQVSLQRQRGECWLPGAREGGNRETGFNGDRAEVEERDKVLEVDGGVEGTTM